MAKLSEKYQRTYLREYAKEAEKKCPDMDKYGRLFS